MQVDDGVTRNGEVRRLEDRVRKIERQLVRKTLEVEILKEAFAKSQLKKDLAVLVATEGIFPVKVIAETLSVFRSNFANA